MLSAISVKWLGAVQKVGRQFPIVDWKESTYSFSNWKSSIFLKNKTRQSKTTTKLTPPYQMQMSNLQLIYSLQILWSMQINAKTRKKKMDSSFKGKLSLREVGENIKMNLLFLLGVFFFSLFCFVCLFVCLFVFLFRLVFSWPCVFGQIHFDLPPRFTPSLSTPCIHRLTAKLLVFDSLPTFDKDFKKCGNALEAEVLASHWSI